MAPLFRSPTFTIDGDLIDLAHLYCDEITGYWTVDIYLQGQKKIPAIVNHIKEIQNRFAADFDMKRFDIAEDEILFVSNWQPLALISWERNPMSYPIRIVFSNGREYGLNTYRPKEILKAITDEMQRLKEEGLKYASDADQGISPGDGLRDDDRPECGDSGELANHGKEAG